MLIRTRTFELVLASLLLITHSAGVPAAENSRKQQIYKDALDAIGACIHWGGEDAFDAERGRDISEGIKRDCPVAKQKAAAAYKLFPDDVRLSEQLLTLNDFGYFELSNQEKEKLCKNSIPVFKADYKKTRFVNPYVQSQCPEQARKIYGK